MKLSIKTAAFFVSALALVLALGFAETSALAAPATGDTIITWSVNNFYPSDYAPKALPANGASITASLEVSRGGKLQDLRSIPIEWYLDGDYLTGGTGKKHASFSVTKEKGGAHALRAIAHFSATDAEGVVSIPIAAREVVIETPYRNGTAKPAEHFSFRAVPYFFNIISLSDLSFSWKVSGRTENTAGNNELTANVGMQEGALPVSVTVRSISSVLEFASDAIQLSVYP